MTWESILKIKIMSDSDGQYKVSDLYKPSEFSDIVHADLREYHNLRRFNTISYDGRHPHVGGAHQYFKPNHTEAAVCMRCMVMINPQ